MITSQPVKCITLSSHQLDQTAVDESASGTDYKGNNVLKTLLLHFSATNAKTITLSVADGTNTIQVYKLSNSTKQHVIKTFDNVNIPDGWYPRLQITKPTAPANVVVNGYLIIQKAPRF